MLIRRCAFYLVAIFLAGFSCDLHAIAKKNDSQVPSRDSHSRFNFASAAISIDPCERYRSFSNETDCMVYLRLLVKEQKYQDLKAIARSGAWHCEFAAESLSDVLPTTQAIAYCRTFRPGSLQWMSAVSVLWKKDRGPVVHYLAEVLSTCNDPYTKVTCYHVCQRANWDDIISYARIDIANDEALYPEVNADVTEHTVGDVARHYCESVVCENARK